MSLQSGSVTARHDYMPFGEEIFAFGGRTSGLGYTTDNVRKQFTAYERDNEIDLDFAGTRYFNSGLARFNSVDSLMASANISNPQTFNRYSYVINNPLNLVDPTGMKSECPKGRKCEKDDEGNEYYIDENGVVQYVGGIASVVTVGAKETAKIIIREPKWYEYLWYKVTKGAKYTGKGFLTLGRFGGSIVTILLNPTSTGCGASPGMIPDGNGWCKRDPNYVDPAKMSDEDEPSEDNPKPDPSETDTPSGTKKKKDKKNEKEKKDSIKKLSPGEIDILKKHRIDPHDLKSPYGKPSEYDLYKNQKGDIIVFRKGGRGEGIETGLNMKDLSEN